MLGGESIEDVDSFVYLGSKVTKDGGAAQDVAQRIQKANTYITYVWNCISFWQLIRKIYQI